MNLGKVHAKYKPNWQTPPEWLRWVQGVADIIGTTVFDPCPGDWKPGDRDGLLPWDPGEGVNGVRPLAYVNHPGGRGQAQRWWERSLFHLRRGDVSRLIWCGFSPEHLRLLDPSPLSVYGLLLIPKKRVAYIDPATGQRQKQPPTMSFFWMSDWQGSRFTMPRLPEECVFNTTG